MPRAQDPSDTGAMAVFQDHRPTLLGIAYRMLGSLADAEDVVQEGWLRWCRADRSSVESPQVYLITVVSRLAIDHMRVASRRRETYVGPWLPEPVQTPGTPLGPAETVAQRDTLSLGALRLLQRLSPPERAVFVLREGFDLPYAEIGTILGVAEAHARQLHRRGGKHLAAGPRRFTADPAAHRALVERFLEAARTGDRAALQSMLAQDVQLWADGGGKIRAALRPILGADRVARFLSGIITKHADADFSVIEFNGQPGILIRLSDRWHVCSPELSGDGVISGIQWMSNPDKLVRVVPRG